MGTNFYLMSKSKKLIRENFAVEKNYGVTDVEYELVDEPYLGYQKDCGHGVPESGQSDHWQYCRRGRGLWPGKYGRAYGRDMEAGR